MNKKETEKLVDNLMNENAYAVEKLMTKNYSGGNYYPTKFSYKLSSQQFLKYKAACRDIIRIMNIDPSEYDKKWFMKSENVSSTEKAPIISATIESEISDFMSALSLLNERDAILAFEKACLNFDDNYIMQRHGASRKEIKEAQHKLITFYAYLKGEII